MKQEWHEYMYLSGSGRLSIMAQSEKEAIAYMQRYEQAHGATDRAIDAVRVYRADSSEWEAIELAARTEQRDLTFRYVIGNLMEIKPWQTRGPDAQSL